MKEIINNNKIKNVYKIENYFSENKYKRILKSPYKLVLIIMIFYFAFSIYSVKKEIKEAEEYIENNTEYVDNYSQNQINDEVSVIEINSGNIRHIFDVIGGRNINRFYCDDSGAELSGKIKDMETVDKIEKNNILSRSYIKKIENKGDYYEFEISK